MEDQKSSTFGNKMEPLFDSQYTLYADSLFRTGGSEFQIEFHIIGNDFMKTAKVLSQSQCEKVLRTVFDPEIHFGWCKRNGPTHFSRSMVSFSPKRSLDFSLYADGGPTPVLRNSACREPPLAFDYAKLVDGYFNHKTWKAVKNHKSLAFLYRMLVPGSHDSVLIKKHFEKKEWESEYHRSVLEMVKTIRKGRL